jgi:hypothetical protein
MLSCAAVDGRLLICMSSPAAICHAKSTKLLTVNISNTKRGNERTAVKRPESWVVRHEAQHYPVICRDDDGITLDGIRRIQKLADVAASTCAHSAQYQSTGPG